MLKKIIKYIKHPSLIKKKLIYKGFYNGMSDERYLKILYKMEFHKELDLENPQTFNEKIQWLKLYDRKPIYSTMVDKYEAKKYVADIIGEKYIVPTLGVWDKFEDIDFDSLPNQFVLKCTHDSGGLVIVKDKAKFDKEVARNKINKCLKRNYYWSGREWPYKNVKPRIIAENYLTDLSNDQIVEYKIFCFSGKAKMVDICKGKAHTDERTNDYCDLDFNRLPFTSLLKNSVGEIEKPKQFQQMVELAEKLSKDIPLLRVDFYLSNENIFWGELTFFHNSGLAKINPDKWDLELGSYITLPKKGE